MTLKDFALFGFPGISVCNVAAVTSQLLVATLCTSDVLNLYIYL